MTKAKTKAAVKAPEPVKKAEVKKPEVKKPYVAPEVKKVEAKAEPVKKVEEKTLKTGKGFKAINSSTVCQLTRRADRTFGMTV